MKIAFIRTTFFQIDPTHKKILRSLLGKLQRISRNRDVLKRKSDSKFR
ncbi:hypothetical protein LEP1GSC193_0907 [Leptospira alstonii serovar Pingchang str. 80-412]|uniref:Uncharacterized protein n=2 Tax=Leptospira alstonii TaxID=28452 RepID=M6CYE4_9LEPT|nr:hypothetical protein LEP1GSC194_3686 [Leptospira alstonii serovar Sichuan str. 79601]EQA80051.1 hypothetical protein LEP1GSC193_0907 [Leptospira alstonii serovar Pingchang str. 80-412]